MRASRLSLVAGILFCFAARADQGAARDGSELRRALAEILASGEYDGSTPASNPLESFWEWVGRRVAELFRGMSRLGEAAPALLVLILIACVVVLLAIFAHAGVILVRALRASRPTKAGPPEGAARGREGGNALLRRAKAAAELGNFAEAIRCCHRAAIMGLDDRGLVRFQDSLTSGDYRRQLADHAADRSIFEALTRIYEPACFGGGPATAATYADSRDLALKLQPGTGS